MKNQEAQRIQKVCADILDGRIGIIQGCRNLYFMHHQSGEFLKSPSFIEALVLSAEDYPEESKRHLYSENYLTKLDDEMKQYLLLIEDGVKQECHNLIHKING